MEYEFKSAAISTSNMQKDTSKQNLGVILMMTH